MLLRLRALLFRATLVANMTTNATENTTANPATFNDWIGREEIAHDVIAPARVAALEATLDRAGALPREGDVLPPLYHWMFADFLGLAATAELGPDGHPKRGGFLPPVTLPRRMWAASDVTFQAPLRIGEEVTRRATIENIEEKTGRSGRLVFVTVRHDYTGASGGVLSDRQTIVYRDAPGESERGHLPPGKPVPADSAFSRILTPGIALLFRYSALIFNAHRIHYDGPYAMDEEGYPGLVVHGPLIATLLADLLRRERAGADITRINFRAVKPIIEGRALTLAGTETSNGFDLWAADDTGDLGAQATIEIR
ncbi:MAG: 3-methylfumaryl-CoA hydratase [Alphaproteobacteria bacterium]